MDDWITRQGNGVAAILFIVFMIVGGAVFQASGVILAIVSVILAMSIAGIMEAVMRINRAIFGFNRVEVHVHRETVYVEKTVFVERPEPLTPYREIPTHRYWDHPETGGESYGIETKRLEGRGRNPRLR